MTELAQIIKQKINQSGQTVNQFASKLGMTTSGLYRLLNRKDMPFTRFAQISCMLNHNLLTDLYPGLTSQSDQNTTLQNENQELKQQISNLTIEKKLLLELITQQQNKTAH
ncbi:MAG TPA: hypothetical protein PK904_17630 [Bacteroidales bacterium]|nr:hypothetical protein [Bacteroidales bacterium]